MMSKCFSILDFGKVFYTKSYVGIRAKQWAQGLRTSLGLVVDRFKMFEPGALTTEKGSYLLIIIRHLTLSWLQRKLTRNWIEAMLLHFQVSPG